MHRRGPPPSVRESQGGGTRTPREQNNPLREKNSSTYTIKYFGVAHGQLGVLTRHKPMISQGVSNIPSGPRHPEVVENRGVQPAPSTSAAPPGFTNDPSRTLSHHTVLPTPTPIRGGGAATGFHDSSAAPAIPDGRPSIPDGRPTTSHGARPIYQVQGFAPGSAALQSPRHSEEFGHHSSGVAGPASERGEAWGETGAEGDGDDAGMTPSRDAEAAELYQESQVGTNGGG